MQLVQAKAEFFSYFPHKGEMFLATTSVRGSQGRELSRPIGQSFNVSLNRACIIASSALLTQTLGALLIEDGVELEVAAGAKRRQNPDASGFCIRRPTVYDPCHWSR